MASYYTEEVKNGTISFKDFILKCAGGKFYEPDELPIKIYESDIASSRENLKGIEKMTLDEANKIAKEKYASDKIKFEESNIKTKLIKENYESMLKQVQNKIPNDEYGFKDFVISQINESIESDCSNAYSEPKEESGKEYKARLIEYFQKNIEFNLQELKKEEKKIQKKKEWIKEMNQILDSE